MRALSTQLVALLLFSAAAFAAGDVSPAAQDTVALGEASQTVAAFHDRLAKGDTVGAKALLDDDVVIFEQGHAEQSKAEYASHHLEMDAKFSAATTRTTTKSGGHAAGDLAYVTHEGRVVGTFNGKPIDTISLETMVLRRDQRGWRIVHIHWSSRAAK